MINFKLISFNNSFSLFLSYFLTLNKIPFKKDKSIFKIQLTIINYYSFFFFLTICENNINKFTTLLDDFTFFQEDESFIIEETKPLTKKKRGTKYFHETSNKQTLLFYIPNLLNNTIKFNYNSTIFLCFLNYFYIYTFLNHLHLFLWFYKFFFLQIINDNNSSSSKI